MVVLLSQFRQRPDDYIEVDVDVAELEGTSAETKATYEKIKKYVAEHNDGMKVSSLNIAQVKRKCGLELGEILGEHYGIKYYSLRYYMRTNKEETV